MIKKYIMCEVDDCIHYRMCVCQRKGHIELRQVKESVPFTDETIKHLECLNYKKRT